LCRKRGLYGKGRGIKEKRSDRKEDEKTTREQDWRGKQTCGVGKKHSGKGAFSAKNGKSWGGKRNAKEGD